MNKPGLAQVGAISKAQNSKRTSKCEGIFFLQHPKKNFETNRDFSTSTLSQNSKKN